MAKMKYLIAEEPLVISLAEGPGHYLDAGDKIEANRVSDMTMNLVKTGRRKARIEELSDDDSNPRDGDEAQPQAHTPGGRTSDGDSQGGGASTAAYDPTEHKVDEVLEYLKTADADEVARVKEAEAAGGRQGGASKTIAAYEPEGGGS